MSTNDFFTWDMLPEIFTKSNCRSNDMIAYYQELIANGLPKRVTAKFQKNICIVGAGISGMMAADLLSRSGYKVTLLEAANRIGGRIHTVHFPNTDDYSEAGAMRLLSDYKLVFKLIEQLNLRIVPFINHDKNDNNLMFVNGVRCTVAEYKKNPDILGFEGLRKEERGLIADDLWMNALKPLMDIVDDKLGRSTLENWKRVASLYGKYSVYTFLRDVAGYSEGATTMIGVMLYLEARMHLSLLQQLVEAVDHSPNSTYFRIVGGNSMLPEAMRSRLEKNELVEFRLNSFVTDINSQEDGTFNIGWKTSHAVENSSGNDKIFKSSTPKRKEEHFDAVIITATPPAIRRMNFNPPLAQKKQTALREINFSASTKIFLEFKRSFWKDYNFDNGSTCTDLPIRSMYYPSDENSKILIASYTWAGAARGWDSLDPQQRIDQSLENVAKVFDIPLSDLQNDFVCGQSYSWDQDDFSMGEAAMIFPEQIIHLAALAEPIGNLFFAGDSLSFKVAWIEGAIESGIRAALEVVSLPPIPSVSLLDCTLRDGGWLNQWGFSLEQAKHITRQSALAGVSYIEVGYRNYPGKIAGPGPFGLSGKCSNDYLKAMVETVRGSDAKIAVMCEADFVKIEDVQEMHNCGVSMIRIRFFPQITDAQKENSYGLLNEAHNLNMLTTANFTSATEVSSDKLVQDIKEAVSHNISFIYISDSVGNFTPERVKAIYNRIREQVDLGSSRLAFHNHNMMDLAIPNALAAINSGISILDCTYRGMGRCAGNVKLEAIVASLHAIGNVSANNVDLLQVLEGAAYMEREIKESLPNPSVEEIALGVYNFNDTNAPLFNQAAKEANVGVIALLAYAAEMNVTRTELTQEYVNQLAKDLAKRGGKG